jgi:hypothetical protein
LNFGVVCRLTVTLETHDKLFIERSSLTRTLVDFGTCFFFFILQHDLGIKQILIVDWDVHHGHGT